MKKPRCFVTLLICCLFLPLTVSGAYGTPGPRMVLAEKSFDFKEVIQGQEVKHVFRVHNKGDQPLSIKNVRTD